MFDVGRDKDTICALSTAAGHGGISVIRVSGENSAAFVRRLCPFLSPALESHKIYFGTIEENVSREPIDEVLVSFFAQGRSYTSEETIEISCHGSSAIAQMILDELIFVGCRIAERGEFTYRAFMNGHIDLPQAEGVLSLVESQSKLAARLALRQLKGHLSRRFEAIEKEIIWLLARLEVSLDFSTEDIEIAPRELLFEKTHALLSRCDLLLATYGQGRILKEGLVVALVGRPNVGKSSLLNALVGEERAIVTDIAGTTRDTIEGRTRINGVPVMFVDTAGLRETSDPIETLGVKKTKEMAEHADHIFLVTEATSELGPEELALVSQFPRAKINLVVNKTDLIETSEHGRLRETFSKAFESDSICWISSKTGEGLGEITDLLLKKLEQTLSEDSDVVIQARHFHLLKKLRERVGKAQRLIGDGMSEEFTALELRLALGHAQEILGTEVNEQIIDRIFGDFCIGK